MKITHRMPGLLCPGVTGQDREADCLRPPLNGETCLHWHSECSTALR